MYAADRVCVQVLGGFQVSFPDGTLAGPWARPSARRLLQVLVLRPGRRIGRQELAALLFPELAPERAANSVSKALSMARTALTPYDVLKADRDVIWLDGDIEVDAEVQRTALRQAIALPPGAARDASIVECLRDKGRLFDEELYADWAATDRQELEGLRASARLTLARDRTGGHGQASTWASIEAWRDVLTHDGSNEEACSASVAAYGSAGMRDMAVRTYHRTAAALHDLGLQPSAPLKAAYAEALDTARRGPPPPEAFKARGCTFGRGAVLAALREVVGRPSRDSSGSVIVHGPAGIGKSHVLDVLAHEFESIGWLVVRAGAAVDDHRAPLRALRNVLGQLDLDGAGDLVRRVVAGDEAGTANDDWRTTRGRLVDQLVALLDSDAAGRPLVLLLDDVQWMDAALREILTALLDRSGARRWAMVLAARSDNAASAIVCPERATSFELMPLPVSAVTELVRRIRPDLAEATIQTVVTRSGGNPFFAIELTRQTTSALVPGQAQASDVPQLIVELLEARLAGCSPQGRRMLSLVSLLDDVATVDQLLRLCAEPGLDFDADTTMRTIDELVGAKLLDERVDGVRLVHPLLRDATVSRLNPARRAALHGLIAAASDGEVAAHHRLAAFEASGRREQARAAAEASFHAGRRARRLFAHEAALDLFEGGLRAFNATGAVDRDDLRAAALDAWCQIGEIHQDRERRVEADRAYEAALALAVSDDERARAWSGTAWSAYRVGDFGACVTAYEQSLSDLQGESPLFRARLETDVGWAYFRLGRRDESLALLERSTIILEDLADVPTRGQALDYLATVLGASGRPEEGLAVMHRAFEAVGLSGDERRLGVLHIHRATLYAELRRFGEALADASAGLRVARAHGDPYVESVAHWVMGFVHERRGDPAAALAEREAELELLEKVGNLRNAALAHAARARLLFCLGRVEESDVAGAQAQTIAAAFEDEAFSIAVKQELGRT